jgi:hypothetical protein
MRTSSERAVNSMAVLHNLLVAEVYEPADPAFGLLRASSGIERCVRCLSAIDALVVFRQPPAAAVLLVAACASSDPKVAATTEDAELIVGLCDGCLGEFCTLEVLPN